MTPAPEPVPVPTVEKAPKKPTFAPMYCVLYPKLATIARSLGYALAVHGSVARDFDLIAVPWVADPSSPEIVVERFERETAAQRIGSPETREHGRLVYTVAFGGEFYLDLSFMPTSRELLALREQHAKLVRHAEQCAKYLERYARWRDGPTEPLYNEAAALMCALDVAMYPDDDGPTRTIGRDEVDPNQTAPPSVAPTKGDGSC
jgi:hypothetical protein